MKPLRTMIFTHANRAWIARKWPNSEGNPPTFWNITPEDRDRPLPPEDEKRAAFAAFQAWLDKSPENVA